jgi:subtilisin family serine protease
MSFGRYSPSELIEEAVDYAYNKGVVLVAAAGNEGRSSKFYPAAYDNVIAAAATDNTDSRMDIVRWGGIQAVSNYGDWVDVAAPGVDIYLTMPTYPVTYNDLLGVSQDYDYLSGTSFSGPHVAGLAALLLSHEPSLSPAEVKAAICNNVDPYNSDVYIGTGRINAYKALNGYNTQPDKPVKLSGKTSGKAGVVYTYSSSTIDPDGDKIFYGWDWDGDMIVDEWTGLFDSGETVYNSHSWDLQGTYEIRVKAKDIYDRESDWSDPLSVSMPKSKSYNDRPFLGFLQSILERFPLLTRLLQPVFNRLSNLQ